MDLRLAVFVDFENVATEDTEKDLFQIAVVLDRLREKGKILVKRAYADWIRFSKYRRELQDHGVEMIEMTTRGMTQKNAGDIKLVVDALETAFTRDYVNCFAIISGDSDFTPLVSKLREFNKSVLGIGRRSSTSRLFIEQCDEFILYESLVKQRQPTPAPGDLFESLKDALVALDRQGVTEPHFSRVKETLARKNPAFDEAAAGFKTFGRFLEAAQRKGICRLLRDAATNTSRITLAVDEERFADAGAHKPSARAPRTVETKLRPGEPLNEAVASRPAQPPAPSALPADASGAAEALPPNVPEVVTDLPTELQPSLSTEPQPAPPANEVRPASRRRRGSGAPRGASTKPTTPRRPPSRGGRSPKLPGLTGQDG